MLPLVLINGLIDSFNPCAVGVLLFYLAMMLSLKLEKRLFISFGLFYIAATYVTYFLIGLGILKVAHLFGVHDFFGWAAAILILALGIFHLKEYVWPRLRIPFLSSFFNRCRIPKWKPEITVMSAITLGVLVGICEFPCSGGVYLATVSLLSIKETFWRGVGYLLLYNFMFVLPLVALFASVSNKAVFQYCQQLHTRTFSSVKLIMALSMIISGLLLIVWLVK